MRFRVHVPRPAMVLALVIGVVTAQTTAIALAASNQSTSPFDVAISASFAAAQRAFVTETNCGSGTCSASIPMTGPAAFSSDSLHGADSWYTNYPLPDPFDCSAFQGYDCWRVYSISYVYPDTSKSGYQAYVSTENDGEQECTYPTNTNGWRYEMKAYGSVQDASSFSVTADWVKGQYLGDIGNAPDACTANHGTGLKMSHWVNINNNWTDWSTVIQGVA